MTWAQLNEIVSLRHEIQSHGWSHKLLTGCSDAELYDEVLRSKNTLEDKLGVPIDALAVPGGDWDRRVAEACARVGYTRMYVSDPWLQMRESTGLLLTGRLMIRRTMDTEALRRVFKAETHRFSTIRAGYRVRQAARRALGNRFYHELWRMLARAGTRDDINRSYSQESLQDGQ
jgi:peptidoglycan/xylan/chitin deacetylase (PgdA/CDA1 family)